MPVYSIMKKISKSYLQIWYIISYSDLFYYMYIWIGSYMDNTSICVTSFRHNTNTREYVRNSSWHCKSKLYVCIFFTKISNLFNDNLSRSYRAFSKMFYFYIVTTWFTWYWILYLVKLSMCTKNLRTLKKNIITHDKMFKDM